MYRIKVVPVQRRSDVKLVPSDWSWHSHGSLNPGKLDLRIHVFENAVTGMKFSCMVLLIGSWSNSLRKLHEI